MIGSHLRYASRSLIKSPGFTAVAMLTLALGIGANTAIFSIVNGVLLKPLPFPEPQQLVVLNNSYTSINLPRASTSPADHVDYRKHTELFQEVASVNGTSFNFSGGDRVERLSGAAATHSIFPMLGIRPVLGRFFSQDEDTPGKDNVAVLDEGVWQRLFGGSPNAIGQTIRLNDKPYQVIGVVPGVLNFLSQLDVWVPAAFTPQQLNPVNRTNQSMFTVARLAGGQSAEQVRQRLAAMTEEFRRDNPQAYPPQTGWSILMTPITELLTGQLSAPLFTLLGAVGFVLLIACANVANLLLARGAARSRELSIRIALGATKWDLYGQMLAESLVLGVASGIAGLAAGYACLQGLIRLAPANFPRIKDVAIDGNVLLFTLAVSLATALLFGLLPALQAGRRNVSAALKNGARASTGRGRVRASLVVAEIALSTLLLVGAGLLVRSFLELQKVDAGFNAGGLISYRVALAGDRFNTPEKSALLFDRLAERTRAIPGVTAVGVVSSLPFSGQNSSSSFQIEGRVTPPNQTSPHGDVRVVNPGYFQTMQIPLKQGRAFTNEDRAGSEPVAVIDEKLAKQYWPEGNAIGSRLLRSNTQYRVIGIVGNIKHSKLDTESKGAYYFVIGQVRIPTLNMMVRTSGDASALRAALTEVDRELPMYDLKLMKDRVLDTLLPQRVAAWSLGALAMVALLLASVGIYGVLSQTVLQRTSEIGIRMALGAQRTQVLQLILREGLALTAIGLVIGACGAAALARAVQKLLFGVPPVDALTYSGVAIILALSAAVACLAPALRASRVDPLVALRYE